MVKIFEMFSWLKILQCYIVQELKWKLNGLLHGTEYRVQSTRYSTTVVYTCELAGDTRHTDCAITIHLHLGEGGGEVRRRLGGGGVG